MEPFHVENFVQQAFCNQRPSRNQYFQRFDYRTDHFNSSVLRVISSLCCYILNDFFVLSRQCQVLLQHFYASDYIVEVEFSIIFCKLDFLQHSSLL